MEDEAAIRRAVELVYRVVDENEQYVGADDAHDEYIRGIWRLAQELKEFADDYYPEEL